MARTKAPRKNVRAARRTRAPKSPGTNTGQLRVRMYRVGFGDFFLLTVPSKEGPQHIVVDCGVTKGKTGKGDIGTIKDAVAHMARETGGKLALIIVTHRHMDHIIGFSRCAEVFQRFKDRVDAIWMPYWETEYDANVSKFQSKLTSLALDVKNHLALASDSTPDRAEMLAMLENATGNVLGMAGTGGGTNDDSLALLKEGFGVKPNYYSQGQKPELPKALVKAGLAAEILGPPPEDATPFMKLEDLKKGVGQYLQAAENGGDSKKFRPFGGSWEAGSSDYPAGAFREWVPRPGTASAYDNPDRRVLEKAVEEAQPSVLLTAVKQLDSFLNNQSLVVLFTYKGKKLLFAGDAQAGNWEYWLYDENDPTKAPALKLGKKGEAVLGALDFYKVGHHGSTNATPIVAVENMKAGTTAMCSTQEGSFGSVEKNSEVPRIPLMEALAKKCVVVRSDQIAVKLPNNEVPAVKGAPSKLQKPRQGSFEVGSCYVDYFI
jgi:beta-lactamase superfamily II metal-dependent hydrolase